MCLLASFYLVNFTAGLPIWHALMGSGDIVVMRTGKKHPVSPGKQEFSQVLGEEALNTSEPSWGTEPGLGMWKFP